MQTNGSDEGTNGSEGTERVEVYRKGCGMFGEAFGNTLATPRSPRDRMRNFGKVPIVGRRIKE